MLTMNLFNALSESRLEYERPFVLACAQERPLEERTALFEARSSMLLLPQQGPYGGLLEKIAKECQCKKQYVSMTLFPSNPTKLFGSSPKQKEIWDTMSKMVRENPLLEPMKEAFYSLETNGEVTLKLKVNLFRFFMKRAENRGIRVSVAEELNTSPRTYKIIKVEP
jgi:hypothetical protein